MSEYTGQRKVEHLPRHVLSIEGAHNSLCLSFNVSIENCGIVVEAVRNISGHDTARVTAVEPGIADEVDGPPTRLNEFEMEFPGDGSWSHSR